MAFWGPNRGSRNMLQAHLSGNVASLRPEAMHNHKHDNLISARYLVEDSFAGKGGIRRYEGAINNRESLKGCFSLTESLQQ
jgi:hypothetical protein